jgi:hypothetical protein
MPCLKRPLGKRQLETLAMMGPLQIAVVTSASHRSLISRGLATDNGKGSYPELTPSGYRALADAIEQGQIPSLRSRVMAAVEARTKNTKTEDTIP